MREGIALNHSDVALDQCGGLTRRLAPTRTPPRSIGRPATGTVRGPAANRSRLGPGRRLWKPCHTRENLDDHFVVDPTKFDARLVFRRQPCEKLSVRLQGGPPGRSRLRLGALAFAHAAAPATAGPAPVDCRDKQKTLGPQST